MPYDVSRLTTGCDASTGPAATTATREAREKSDAAVKCIVRVLELDSDEAGVVLKCEQKLLMRMSRFNSGGLLYS